ncbi:kinase-like domain-containing protein [Sphaerosporella brunnea]|uniref:Kinase-like domain-containing protein n=1 Tax=Sphaerosporella brunnea TaxID=1250544 RepID=A0A5J5EVM8_9PEZI|nr:kinase-like domain-containing protein [Sphaerosporella brunnea]
MPKMANGTLGFTSSSNLALTDRFEIIKEVGDGSFGSVVLAKVRSAGANVARRGSVVAIKTMKKSFESFAPCLELREVIFLRQLPVHAHLVPALDIFLDPHTKKLHIAMEYMDGNLYQLMKAREGKLLEGSVVKSILFQILSGLEHIHANGFFHRDIKPENILVSTSATNLNDTGSFRRYSAMVTPPSTPPVYSVKIADFGLARETSSKMPYTTYVSTRWYRAPEVLLRAGEYSAPVDIWAVGAMAVEVATLKPLFPGGNEVDQVWRVCEVMGSPGQWVGRSGKKMGGGEWREGTRLAGRLGFSFPRMAPVPMESILATPTWPASLAQFVTWCLMWDPRARPTSIQALQHEYFRDAVDPLLPRSATPSRASRKTAELSMKPSKDSMNENQPTLEKKNSWFRKSFIGVGGRADGVVSPPPTTNPDARIRVEKRSTWHAPKIGSGSGAANNGAPMMILPSIRPVSPLSDAVSVQAARSDTNKERRTTGEKAVKKIGRQLSVASKHSQENGYTNGVQHAVDKLNGNVPGGAVVSPTSQKESFFSHLRKRARRLSGRAGLPPSPGDEDLETGVGCGMWGGKDSGSNRSSMLVDSPQDGSGIDKAIKEVDAALGETGGVARSNSAANLRRNLSFPPTPNASRAGETAAAAAANGVATTPSFPRTRRSVRNTKQRYETPDEHDELADEVLAAASGGYDSRQSSQNYDAPIRKNSHKDLRLMPATNGYPTPSPQAAYRHHTKGLDISGKMRRDDGLPDPKWPTPPSEGDAGWGPHLFPTGIRG